VDLPVIVRQDYLLDHVENSSLGSLHESNITFYFSFSDEKVICSGKDLTMYIEDYSDFPIVTH
jgi:hypothetical protein